MASFIHLINDSDCSDEEMLRRPRNIRPRSRFFYEYDDVDFKTRFRLSKSSALSILEEIEDDLEFPDDRNHAISPINQLLLALRYYATGSFLITIGDYMGVSKPTAHRIIHRVSRAIASLRIKYIRFPENEREVREAQLKMYNICSFPKCIGAMDCTHIKIQSPGGNEAERFRNRKGYFSLNVQGICSSNLEFLNIVARWPGSAHDSTIFNASNLRARFEAGEFGDSLLLGDSGYPLTPYLMTPIDNPQIVPEQLYNESQIRSRNCIERTFGLWKRRFPVLAIGFQMQLKNIFPIIVATAVLHNILREMGDDHPIDDSNLYIPSPWEELLVAGNIPCTTNQIGNQRSGAAARSLLVRNYFERLQYL